MVWCGVLLTGFSTLGLLALQQYGLRKLELLITFLVIVACFLVELGVSKLKASEMLYGMFVPQLKGSGSTGLAISLLGAMVMSHNLFLHSALVLSRKIPRIKEACRFYLIESGIALAVAFLINISVISVSGPVYSSSNLNPDDQKSCQDLYTDNSLEAKEEQASKSSINSFEAELKRTSLLLVWGFSV